MLKCLQWQFKSSNGRMKIYLVSHLISHIKKLKADFNRVKGNFGTELTLNNVWYTVQWHPVFHHKFSAQSHVRVCVARMHVCWLVTWQTASHLIKLTAAKQSIVYPMHQACPCCCLQVTCFTWHSVMLHVETLETRNWWLYLTVTGLDMDLYKWRMYCMREMWYVGVQLMV